jgi:signal transduction histidine kinase
MAELRLRTALELHDGILQTLTGATLQLAVARRLVGADPAGAEKVLAGLGESISAEQQEMRLFVDELKGSAPLWADGTLGLPQRIEALMDRMGMIWGLTSSVETSVEVKVGGELARQVLRIIQEATVNAARHGSAKNISVSVTVDGAKLTIAIADDGEGFNFLGEYDHEALHEKRLGPLSLKHRVKDTGGRISINSTPKGSTIVVRLPFQLQEEKE